MSDEADQDILGWIYAILAFCWWGTVMPLYLIMMKYVAQPYLIDNLTWSLEVLMHRVIWCVLTCLLLIQLRRGWDDFWGALRSKRTLATLALTALLVGSNWLCFILAPALGKLSDASLGYYINPMLNVWLGYMFLGESLRRLQGIAVALAGIGVAWLVFVHGEVPWISLLLAGTFGIYGLLKKRLEVHAITGLTFEALYCLPLVLIYFAVRGTQGPEFVFTQSGATLNMLLVGFGPVTAAPLIWFAAGAKRLRLATVGMLQFLAPTLQLTVALIANGETLPPAKIGGFLFIWAGVLVYIWDIRLRSKARPVVEPSGE